MLLGTSTPCSSLAALGARACIAEPRPRLPTSQRSAYGSCRFASEPLPPTVEDDKIIRNVIRLGGEGRAACADTDSGNATALRIKIEESKRLVRQTFFF